MSEELEFHQYVDSMVESLWLHGTREWSSLLRSLPGITPDLVLQSLHRQELLADLRFDSNASRIQTPAPFAYRLWREGSLPTPHLLDACWWFADSAIATLSTRIIGIDAEAIVLLGAPTLFHALSRNDTLSGALTLIDRDAKLCTELNRNHHQVVIRDVIHDDLPELSADLVVADPPWYAEELKGFLWAARSFAKQGSTVMLSVPPEGTRPGIEAEKELVFKWAEGLGFVLASYEVGRLSYLSPPFEQNAFEVAQLARLDDEWRHGDLVTFNTVADCRIERPTFPVVENWVECAVGDVRFRIRRPEIAEYRWNNPSLISILPGDLLASVSRRSTERMMVDIWTSGNRVFKCSGRQVLISILQALSCSENVLPFVERKLGYCLSDNARTQVLNAEEHLRRIIEQESCEYHAIQRRYKNVDIIPN